MESLPTESPAPALERGIAILNILNSGESYSLETISKKLKLPRSSLLRLLSTLQRCGWIQRNEDKHYHTLITIQPIDSKQSTDWISYRNLILQKLGNECELTIEWFEVEKKLARIIWRHEPTDKVVQVKARLDFCRHLRGEIDAIARLLLKHSNHKPGPEAWVYKDGDEIKIKNNELKTLPWSKGEPNIAYDTEYNSNGVRRIAFLLDQSKGRPAGIVSLAESYTPKAKQKLPLRIQALTRAYNDLNHF